MKRRAKLVSNSSSSSYTCEVCGETCSGYDCGLNDFDMSECRSGHVFCKEHTTIPPQEIIVGLCDAISEDYLEPEERSKIKTAIEEGNLYKWIEGSDIYSYVFGENCELNKVLCPICSLAEIRDSTMLNYMFKKFKVSREEIEEDIREKFSSLTELESS